MYKKITLFFSFALLIVLITLCTTYLSHAYDNALSNNIILLDPRIIDKMIDSIHCIYPPEMQKALHALHNRNISNMSMDQVWEQIQSDEAKIKVFKLISEDLNTYINGKQQLIHTITADPQEFKKRFGTLPEETQQCLKKLLYAAS